MPHLWMCTAIHSRRGWKDYCLEVSEPVLILLVTQLCLTLATPRTVAHQAPLSMEFSRQEQWSGLPLPSPGDIPDSGIEPVSPALQETMVRFLTIWATKEAPSEPNLYSNYCLTSKLKVQGRNSPTAPQETLV